MSLAVARDHSFRGSSEPQYSLMVTMVAISGTRYHSCSEASIRTLKAETRVRRLANESTSGQRVRATIREGLKVLRGTLQARGTRLIGFKT